MTEQDEAPKPNSVIEMLLKAHPGLVPSEDPDTLIGRMLAQSRSRQSEA